MSKSDIRAFVGKSSWIWPLAGTIALWLGMGAVRSGLNFGFLSANGVSACFLAIAAMGQMLVITSGTGGGAIDLSIPSIITLSAFVATETINGSNANIAQAVALVLAIGAMVGLCNGLSVVYLKIPPIIATMAVGNIVTTCYLLYNEHFTAFHIAPLLLGLTRSRLLGIPLIVYFLAVIGLLAAYLLGRITFGQSLLAVGQSHRAANLAGIRTSRVLIITYVISGACSGLAGILISARAGGAFLDMGSPYLMQTIGAVVLGGTLMLGGKATTLGTVFGSLFLVLLITTMQAAGLSLGMQRIFEGAIIIAVLALASGRRVEE
jgi:ribose transport system permease protein